MSADKLAEALREIIKALAEEHDGTDFEAECPLCWAHKDAKQALAEHEAEKQEPPAAVAGKLPTRHPLCSGCETSAYCAAYGCSPLGSRVGHEAEKQEPAGYVHSDKLQDQQDALLRRLVRMEHDFPPLSEFHRKHALGPMMAPSCLVCGHTTLPMALMLPDSVAIKHAELPGIVVCMRCRDAAQQDKRDAERLDWLDSQSIAYGFEDVHEGNAWEIRGPFANLRAAIDAARKANQ